jgi:hypothetical protein
MESKKSRETDVVVYGWPSVMKWAYFDRRSTTVSMMDLPLTRGRPSTKSLAMSHQTAAGTTSGCRRPAGWSCSDLFCCHVGHAHT